MTAHPLPITALYVALAALILMGLAGLVIRQRARFKVVFGEGDANAAALKRAIRAHGNAVEFVPISLLVLLCCEMAGMAPWAVHAWGCTLIVARLAHASGLAASEGQSLGRGLGAGLQFTFLTGLPLWLLARIAGLI